MTDPYLPVDSRDVFSHIRVIVGMILGISIARLVGGTVSFLQRPRKEEIYLIHLGWAVFVFLCIIHFWWFEFALLQIGKWTFGLYFVLICYSVVFVMLAVMLFPDPVLVPAGFREYFNGYGRRFYAIVIGMVIIDTLDTLIKGPAYYRRMYGVDYPVRQVLLAAGAAGGLVIQAERYHALFVVVALLFQVAWIVGLFGVIGSN
jgi:hypothetical protein